MKRKNRKFNFKKILIFFVLIIIVALFVRYLFNIRVKNIIILNNAYYTDENIIEMAGLGTYPKLFKVRKSKIRKNLLSLKLIEDVNISVSFSGIVKIDVKEKKILYYDRSNDTYALSDGKKYELKSIYGVPTLINYVPTDIEEKFIKAFKNIDSDIIYMISEIEYNKSDYDPERFVLTMNDGNQVYININRLELLNKYIEIKQEIGNKNGILYLDSGNYFEVKK